MRAHHLSLERPVTNCLLDLIVENAIAVWRGVSSGHPLTVAVEIEINHYYYVAEDLNQLSNSSMENW